MAVDMNKLEIHGKKVNLLCKIRTIYKKYVDIVQCHRRKKREGAVTRADALNRSFMVCCYVLYFAAPHLLCINC